MEILLVGSGSALPEKIVSNDDLAKIVDTSDEWISTRTGIKERRICEKESLSALSTLAAKRALDAAKVDAEDIDLIVAGTTTADKSFPGCACEVQAGIGASHAVCFDVSAACSGFVFALHSAECMMRGGGYRSALVLGADAFSRVLDWSDRSTCVLFGDGAGAVVLKAKESERVVDGILGTKLGSDGSRGDSLVREAFGENPYVKMCGQEVFKFAVRTVPEVIDQALERAKITKKEVDWYILHQANERIIQSVAKKLEEAMEKFPMNLSKVGNTSGASVAILLDEEIRSGRIQKGDVLVLSGFGAGLTWGATVIKY